MARILVVDDVPANITMLVELLRSEHTVQVATFGEKALLIATGDPPRPDLVLLDIDMPGMDGFEVCRQLKEFEETRRIPVIFVTAKDDQLNEEKGFELGAVDYITKPFEASEFRARLRSALRISELMHMLAQRAQIDSIFSDAAYNNLRISLTRENVAFANPGFNNGGQDFATQRSLDV